MAERLPQPIKRLGVPEELPLQPVVGGEAEGPLICDHAKPFVLYARVSDGVRDADFPSAAMEPVRGVPGLATHASKELARRNAKRHCASLSIGDQRSQVVSL